jgi:hypothetical protein
MWAGLWVEVFGTTPGNLLETNGGPTCAILHRVARIRELFHRQY